MDVEACGFFQEDCFLGAAGGLKSFELGSFAFVLAVEAAFLQGQVGERFLVGEVDFGFDEDSSVGW